MSDWENYRYLLAIARAGTLSAAARILGVDHATVSRRLTAFETSLDVSLVDRFPRHCQLTPLGQDMLSALVAMEEGSDRIARLARAAREPKIDTVTLSAPPVLVTHLLAPNLARFRQQFPLVRLSLTGETRQVSLRRREADIAMGTIRPREADSIMRKIGHLTYRLYARRDYPHLSEPDKWEFVAFDRRFDEEPQPRWLLSAVGDRQVVCELNDLNGHLIAAKTGVGIAGLPAFIGDADPDLVVVGPDVAPFAREIWLVVHRDVRGKPSLRGVMDFLVSLVSEKLP